MGRVLDKYSKKRLPETYLSRRLSVAASTDGELLLVKGQDLDASANEHLLRSVRTKTMREGTGSKAYLEPRDKLGSRTNPQREDQIGPYSSK